MNSETPRTDAAAGAFDINGYFCQRSDYQDCVPIDFARQLERELNEAKAAHKEASEYAQCAYCRTKIIKNPLHVLEHMQVCEKHPMRILAARIAELERGLKSVQSLIDDSYGVAGLHLNGAVAPWDSIRTGGAYEEWLIDFDAAMKGNQ